MQKFNKDLRKAMNDRGIYHYQLAHALGVDPTTLCRWLRFELPADKKKAILEAIEQM